MTNRISTIRAVALCLAAAVISVGVGCGGSDDESSEDQAGDAISVRFGINNPYFNGNIPVTVAEKKGFFDENGLDVTTVPTTSPMPALIAGDTDMAVTGTPPWLSAADQGKRTVALATLLPKITQAVMVKPDSPLAEFKGQWPEAVQAMDGMSVGVSVAGAQVDLTTRYMLKEAGLEPDEDVTIRALGGGTPQLSALQADRVESIMGFVPGIQQLETSGEGVPIIDFTDPPEGFPPALRQPYMIAAASPGWIEENPEGPDRLRKALADTYSYMSDPENEAEVQDLLAPEFEGLSPELLSEVVKGTVDDGFQVDYTCKDLDEAKALMSGLGMLASDVSCEDYVDAG